MTDIDTHIAGMIDPHEGGLGAYQHNNFLTEVVAICGNTMIRVCDVLCSDAQEKRRRGVYFEDWSRHVGLVEGPLNAAGRQRHHYLQFRHDGNIYLAAMTLRVKRVSSAERPTSREDILKTIMADLKLKGDEPDAVITTEIEKLNVFALGDGASSERQIKAAQNSILADGPDAYSEHKVFEVSPAGSRSSGTWMPGHVNGHQLHANVVGFGAALRAALRHRVDTMTRIADGHLVEGLARIAQEADTTQTSVARHWMLEDETLKSSIRRCSWRSWPARRTAFSRGRRCRRPTIASMRSISCRRRPSWRRTSKLWRAICRAAICRPAPS